MSFFSERCSTFAADILFFIFSNPTENMPTLNVKSTQQPIKVGEHKGEEVFIMKV